MLTFDYLGALGASLLFPLLLVPHLGLVRSALLFGSINAGVALWSTCAVRERRCRRAARCRAASVAVARAARRRDGCGANASRDSAEDNLYADEVDLRARHAVPAHRADAWKDDLRLFLNSHLQFSSRDEYRYHEALVHPGLAALPDARRVLVLGGGDGLAVREILQVPGRRARHAGRSRSGDDAAVLDASAADAAQRRTRSPIPRVHVVNADAFVWLDENAELVRLRGRRLSRSVQLLASASSTRRRSTGCWRGTSRPAGRSSCRARRRCSRASRSGASSRRSKRPGCSTYPYHVYVPSFGEWGFVLATHGAYTTPTDAAGRTALPDDGRGAAGVRVPARHGAGRRRAEPAERPDARALLRRRVRQDQPVAS